MILFLVKLYLIIILFLLSCLFFLIITNDENKERQILNKKQLDKIGEDFRKYLKNKQMNEAIFILEKEKKLLESCLKGFNKEEYTEAFKQRNKKHKEITFAIELLKSKIY